MCYRFLGTGVCAVEGNAKAREFWSLHYWDFRPVHCHHGICAFWTTQCAGSVRAHEPSFDRSCGFEWCALPTGGVLESCSHWWCQWAVWGFMYPKVFRVGFMHNSDEWPPAMYRSLDLYFPTRPFLVVRRTLLADMDKGFHLAHVKWFFPHCR